MRFLHLILQVLAIVLFLLAGLNVPARYNLIAWGLFCLALAQFTVTAGLM